jgi:hypothetical protein
MSVKRKPAKEVTYTLGLEITIRGSFEITTSRGRDAALDMALGQVRLTGEMVDWDVLSEREVPE